MVGHLVSLKWQYVLASFRRSVWALIGLIFAALYAGGMLFGLGSTYVIANSEVPEYGQLGTLLVGTVVALAWAIVPIFFSGLDGTLDESRFVLFPIKPSTLQKGQFLGGFVGIPGIASIIAVLLGAIAFAMLLMMSAGFIFGGTITYLTKHWEEVLPYLPWLSVTPFGSAFAVPYFMATGNMGTALGCLALTLVYLAGGWWLWGKNLARSMANVGGSAHHASAAEVAAGDLGLLARFPATPRGAVAARTLHSFLKDNRLQLLTASTAMLYLILTVAMPLFLSSVGSFESRASFNGVNAAEANQIINSGVMQLFGFWMYFCTVFTGYYMCYLVSYDNTAFSLHVLSPLRGIDDRLGRLWGYSILMVPIVVVMVFVASAANGHLELFPIVLMHQLGVLAAAAGMGSVMDTFISPPVAPPGANPFKNPKNNEGFANQLLLMLTVILVMLSALPGGISVVVYIFRTQDVLTLVYGGLIQLLIGAALLVGGVAWGGHRYDKVSSKMLERVARFQTN